MKSSNVDSLVEVNGLAARAGAFRLGPLSLQAADGAHLVILGPSGCGKSTLLRCLAGLHPMDSGHVRVAGEDVSRLPPDRRRIGLMAQSTDLFPHMTVLENVAFGLRYAGMSSAEKARTLGHMMELFRLQSFSNRKASTLSGGEGRKAALARSLAASPRILLLDEPLGMLDPNSRADTLAALRLVHAELGVTTIHVTHDRAEAWEVATSVAVILNGRVVESGLPSEVFRRPRTRKGAEFLGAVNILPAVFDGMAARTSAGTFLMKAATTVLNGWITLRPECAEVVRRKADAILGIPAVVAESRDLGGFVQLLCDIGGTRLAAQVPLSAAGAYPAGMAVELSWPPEAVHPIFDSAVDLDRPQT